MRGWKGRGEGRNEREGKRRGPQGLVHTPCPKSWKIPIAKLIRLVGAAKPRDAPGSKHPRAATEFGWVPFADLRLRSLHDNEAERRIHGGWVKWRTNSKPVVDQSSWHFETMYETFCRFQRTCVYRFRFRRYRPLKLPLSCKIVEKVVCGLPIFRGRVIPRLRTCIFKAHSLSSIWSVLIEFRLASSEGSWRKTDRRQTKMDRIAVKLSPPTNMSGSLKLIKWWTKGHTQLSFAFETCRLDFQLSDSLAKPADRIYQVDRKFLQVDVAVI